MFLEIRKLVASSLFALAAVPGLTRELKALREGSANKGSGFGVQVVGVTAVIGVSGFGDKFNGRDVRYE